jgi:uncharacterized protein (TIGR03437 family)
VYVVDSNNGRIRVLNPVPAPSIDTGGIPVIQSGSRISIYGKFLANSNTTWNGDFPTSLGGVGVTIHNKPVYVSFVSQTLINAQAPYDGITGSVNIMAQTPPGPSLQQSRLQSSHHRSTCWAMTTTLME